jgi:hypothetical protein
MSCIAHPRAAGAPAEPIGPDNDQADREIVEELLRSEPFTGLAGEFVRAIEPETEADPTLLLYLLAAFGNIVGRGPHFAVDAARDALNLYVVCVGRTGAASHVEHGTHGHVATASGILEHAILVEAWLLVPVDYGDVLPARKGPVVDEPGRQVVVRGLEVWEMRAPSAQA